MSFESKTLRRNTPDGIPIIGQTATQEAQMGSILSSVVQQMKDTAGKQSPAVDATLTAIEKIHTQLLDKLPGEEPLADRIVTKIKVQVGPGALAHPEFDEFIDLWTTRLVELYAQIVERLEDSVLAADVLENHFLRDMSLVLPF